ncbi:MAG: hypothetical protein ACPL28_11905 [bacterium]
MAKKRLADNLRKRKSDAIVLWIMQRFLDKISETTKLIIAILMVLLIGFLDFLTGYV